MKRFKRRVLPGVVIGMPIEGSSFCPSKVLYSSTMFKDVMLIGVLGRVTPFAEAQLIDLEGLFSHSSYMCVLYTAATCVPEPWPILGNATVLPSDIDLTTRTVGGEVWREDEFIREASQSDLRNLPKMSVEGCACAEETVLAALKKRKLLG